ncbi:hypothetical protein SAMN02745857_03607 [Andreprevotia lacus DSM 23236]|jgi:hypothetical protein|uniref:Uncharacterized protein n=1 Tax=Andreprevotia lacus DSM 23236 TaxID=1121001 RepID=A0A1W1XZ07_9NEIS|nr:hypothetical protein [Andreprevotia lacus]SMC29105.1 hypothetical protein SAMN02745857_03607 [Andreprevotia lacus DSM 23236]
MADPGSAQDTWLAPTPRQRWRNWALLLLGVALVTVLALARQPLLARLGTLPVCRQLLWAQGLLLLPVCMPLLFSLSLAHSAWLMFRHRRWPLRGNWLLRPTRVKGWPEIRWQAWKQASGAALMLLITPWLFYLLFSLPMFDAQQVAKRCPGNPLATVAGQGTLLSLPAQNPSPLD